MAQESLDLTIQSELVNRNVQYPFEYFDAQVQFAKKWSELSGEPLNKTLLEKTALYRRVTNTKHPKDGPSPIWQDVVGRISALDDPKRISKEIYLVFLRQPHSEYTPPYYPEDDGKHFGYFSFDHYPEDAETGYKDRIKVHFINRNRGEKSGLDPSFLTQRRNDLKRMFTQIRKQYPQAEEVVGGSWLYALKAYRDSFPAVFTVGMKRLVPKGYGIIPDSVPSMSFNGDSLWGQFINRRGEVREPAYQRFLENVGNSRSLNNLVDSFPDKPYQPRVPISVFYDWIDRQPSNA